MVDRPPKGRVMTERQRLLLCWLVAAPLLLLLVMS
jgi:hypothetical protein